MNTAQTYAGKTSVATDTLNLHLNSLHQYVDDYVNETSAANEVEVLSELLYSWLADSVGYDEDDEARDTKRYELRSHHLERIHATHRLMVNVVRIMEQGQLIERIKERPVKLEAKSRVSSGGPGPLHEKWQATFLTHVIAEWSGIETLFYLLSHVSTMHDSTDPTWAVTKLLSGFTENPGTDLNDEENRQLIKTVTGHLANMAELRATFGCFDSVTGYTNTASENE